MELERHLAALQADGQLLAAAAERAGVTARVPTCPGWRIAELLRHVGYVHRWAAMHVERASPELVEGPSEEEILQRGPAEDELLDWYREGHTALIGTLTSAEPTLSCWTFLDAPSPLAFWARRQAHETAIHRADAEAALGSSSSFDTDFAADGIDELLVGFAPGERLAASINTHKVLGVYSRDTGDCWQVSVDPEGIVARRGTGPADCTIEGAASDLYLTLWNRTRTEDARLAITGDSNVLQLWRTAVHVGWN